MACTRSDLAPVLLVEDNPDVEHLITLLLKRSGYGVVHAANGADALQRLSNGLRPCVILLDYHMPVMDGRVFRQQQLARGVQADVPVILYSSDTTIAADEMKAESVFVGCTMHFRDVVLAIDHSRLSISEDGMEARCYREAWSATR